MGHPETPVEGDRSPSQSLCIPRNEQNVEWGTDNYPTQPKDG